MQTLHLWPPARPDFEAYGAQSRVSASVQHRHHARGPCRGSAIQPGNKNSLELSIYRESGAWAQEGFNNNVCAAELNQLQPRPSSDQHRCHLLFQKVFPPFALFLYPSHSKGTWPIPAPAFLWGKYSIHQSHLSTAAGGYVFLRLTYCKVTRADGSVLKICIHLHFFGVLFCFGRVQHFSCSHCHLQRWLCNHRNNLRPLILQEEEGLSAEASIHVLHLRR